jgi:hypothetical protein
MDAARLEIRFQCWQQTVFRRCLKLLPKLTEIIRNDWQAATDKASQR